MIRIFIAKSPANYKLPLLVIHFGGCSEADTALSIAEFSRTEALRYNHTLSVKLTRIGDESVLVVRAVISGRRVFVCETEREVKSRNERRRLKACFGKV